MRRVVILAVIVATGLTFTTRAQAVTLASTYHPSAADLATAASIAHAYWHGSPPCGEPIITQGDPVPGTDDSAAEPAACTIVIRRTTNDFSYTPAGFCLVVVHEYGHLVLGPAFAAVNPSDPWHSPDPTSVMYAYMTGNTVSVPACTAFAAQRDAWQRTRKHHRRR